MRIGLVGRATGRSWLHRAGRARVAGRDLVSVTAARPRRRWPWEHAELRVDHGLRRAAAARSTRWCSPCPRRAGAARLQQRAPASTCCWRSTGPGLEQAAELDPSTGGRGVANLVSHPAMDPADGRLARRAAAAGGWESAGSSTSCGCPDEFLAGSPWRVEQGAAVDVGRTRSRSSSASWDGGHRVGACKAPAEHVHLMLDTRVADQQRGAVADGARGRQPQQLLFPARAARWRPRSRAGVQPLSALQRGAGRAGRPGAHGCRAGWTRATACTSSRCSRPPGVTRERRAEQV